MNIDSQIKSAWSDNDYYKFDSIDVLWAFEYYEFISNGRFGNIPKGVVFQKDEETPYQLDLVYGDVATDIKVNTSSVTNNGDLNKLLLTIAVIAITFLARHPGYQIKLNGINNVRTRLYRKFINIHIDALVSMVNIYGQNSVENLTELIRHSYNKDYDYLLVEIKNS